VCHPGRSMSPLLRSDWGRPETGDRSAVSDDVTLTGGLEDGDVRPGFDWSRLELDRLARVEAGRRVVGIVMALVVLFWPGRTGVVLGRIVGLTLIVYAASALRSAIRIRPMPRVRTLVAAATLGIGGFLVVVPAETGTTLGRLVGLVLVGKGSWELVVASRGDGSELAWRVSSASATIAVGLLSVALPTYLLSVVVVTVGCVFVVVELIALSIILDPDRGVDTPFPTPRCSSGVGSPSARRPSRTGVVCALSSCTRAMVRRPRSFASRC
jgi:uncharacterized membrane protein HdeD (DUF308 family)